MMEKPVWGDWFSHGSQSAPMKIAKANQSWNVIRKGYGGIEEHTQISNTGRVSKREMVENQASVIVASFQPISAVS